MISKRRFLSLLGAAPVAAATAAAASQSAHAPNICDLPLDNFLGKPALDELPTYQRYCGGFSTITEHDGGVTMQFTPLPTLKWD